MGRMEVCFLGILVTLCAFATGEGDFPPPPMPHPPRGFNIHCDVCNTMTKRVVPYCERQDENQDYLPDFCTFNYNQVLRSECDHIVKVMEYAWCPNACSEVRRLLSYTGEKICHHPLVNCTERFVPSASPSPSPSPSMQLSGDCVLCEYVLKHSAVMCMNKETANAANIYHVCMQQTKTKEDYERCTMFLNELVSIAKTDDPCELITCADPKVTCQMTEPLTCHVVEYTGDPYASPNLGMDKDGNLFRLSDERASKLNTMTGLGPSDFRPGRSPYHSLEPRKRVHLPAHVRQPGHLVGVAAPPVEDEEEAVDAEGDASAQPGVPPPNARAAAQAQAAAVPLREIKMQ